MIVTLRHTAKDNFRFILAALVCCAALVALAGCSGVQASSDPVRLVITPVATPTTTPLAAPTQAPTTYTVKSGDTLYGIAAIFGVTVDDIVRANNIADPNVLSEGQVLKIPGRSAGGTATSAPAGTATPGGTPAPQGTPPLPPPNVTPPMGPTTGPGGAGDSSVPRSTISPTAEP